MKESARAALRAARGWRLAYLASPYRAFPKGHWPAVVEAAQAAARLMRHGVKLYSPITHGWPISQYGGIDGTNNEFWTAANAPFAELCDGLIVLQMDGWSESAGINEEVRAFMAAGKPVVHLAPDDLE